MSRSPQAQTPDPAHANDGVLALGIGARVALLAVLSGGGSGGSGLAQRAGE